MSFGLTLGLSSLQKPDTSSKNGEETNQSTNTLPCSLQPVSLSKFVIRKEERQTRWMYISGALDLLHKNTTAYAALLQKAGESGNEEVVDKITRDISRTFSSFSTKQQKSLLNVLKTYAIFNPEVAYCQGMNFVAGIITATLPEDQAFWVFVQIMKKYDMATLYIEGLQGLHEKLDQFDSYTQTWYPELYLHFKDQRVSGLMFATKWFLTLFGCKLPLADLQCVMDLFFQMGWSIIFAMGLAILKCRKDNLIRLPIEDMLVLLEQAPTQIPMNLLLKEALAIQPLLGDSLK